MGEGVCRQCSRVGFSSFWKVIVEINMASHRAELRSISQPQKASVNATCPLRGWLDPWMGQDGVGELPITDHGPRIRKFPPRRTHDDGDGARSDAAAAKIDT